MEYYVDIADIDAVRRVNETFPIDGFTTNPNILTKATRPLPELFAAYRDYIRETGQRLFTQVTASDAAGMVGQAKALRDYFGENLVVKGVDFRALPVGTLLRCGDVLLEMTQIGKECHAGCAILQQVGDCIMPRRGVFCRILKGGVVKPGDSFRVTFSPAILPLA